MNNKKIYATLPNGIKIEFDVILTFKNELNGKNYIVYTDNMKDEYNKLRIYSSIYNPNTLELLGQPETKEEWNEIYKLLDKVLLDN